ncbi:hypothetical protein CEE37_12770 [candidate division LCP-89 bacterium B3_LCP]|uniref:DUF4837 domain-containing protein n=1 Tax=candidate division LCP-89 bacterium B3_LCP TaxID=2012998 RepID=A0A532UUD7_UNCL8|nr:MAG: hypothetical protein CEE37_12770 [candidate division LCP-89 bacterium B3_LCP]
MHNLKRKIYPGNVTGLFVIIALTIILLSGCTIKPEATGQENSLCILIDPELRDSIENTLLQVFCPIIETPQPERRFNPVFAGMDEIANVQTSRNLLIVAVLNQSGPVSQLVFNMLSPEIVQGVSNGEYFVFSKENEWAKDQQMMILVMADPASMISQLQEEGGELFSIFDDVRTQKVKKDLYRRHEQKKLAADVRERYGFDMRIPHDYYIVREEQDDGWLRLKRGLAPGRWITLWKSEPLLANPVDTSWVYQTWSMLAASFADTVQANLDYLHFKEIEVAGLPALEMWGLWETKGPQGGGPFVCRAFFNPNDKRAYLIEGEVFFPRGEKEPFLRQVEVILSTFKVDNNNIY